MLASSEKTLEGLSHYRQFTQLVQDEIGVRLDESKRVMVEARLRRRFSTLGYEGLDGYLSYLFDQGGLARERAEIFDAVTTTKTDFFREPEHFHHLMTQAVPEAVQRRRAGGDLVRIWSAAASSGAEAWTIALCLAACRERLGAFDWMVLGTDINRRVLETARRAIYPDSFLEPIPSDIRARWLMRGTGAQLGQSRIVPELRHRVRFQQLNLLNTPLPLQRDIDIVFLRNVLIYFSSADQNRVISTICRHLAPGGILYLGHSESMMSHVPQLRQIAPSTFLKEV